MLKDVDLEAIGNSRLISRDPLSAWQWELFLARTAIERGVRAWRAVQVSGYDAWRRELHELSRPSSAKLISERQALTIWRRIIAESPQGPNIIDHRSLARWAQSAWRLSANYGIDLDKCAQVGNSSDFLAFRNWAQQYRDWLREHDWIDQAGLEGDLRGFKDASGRDIVVLDPGRVPGRREALFENLVSRGWRIRQHDLPSVPNRSVKLCASNDLEELQLAIQWLSNLLGSGKPLRIALIVDRLDERRHMLDSLLDSAGITYGHWNSPSLVEKPAVESALQGLEMLSPMGDFLSLSGWLRSPYFHSDTSDALSNGARCEARLRETLWAQMSFRECYESGGLGEYLRRHEPGLSASVDAALSALPARAAELTPSAWARSWRSALRHLGWGKGVSTVPQTQTEALERGLEQLATLTPVLGRIAYRAAIEELISLLRTASGETAELPLGGVHVFDSCEQLGPGYDAAWVMGCTSDAAFARGGSSPILPLSLQRQFTMPWSTPADGLQRNRDAVNRMLRGVPQVVWSWPDRMDGAEQRPSALLEDVSRSERKTFVVDRKFHYQRPLEHAGLDLEVLDDNPPAFRKTRIAGGVGALNAQSRCPTG